MSTPQALLPFLTEEPYLQRSARKPQRSFLAEPTRFKRKKMHPQVCNSKKCKQAADVHTRVNSVPPLLV